MAGRPPLFETDETLSSKVAEYFEYIKGEYIDVKSGKGKKETTIREWIRFPEPPTITGLALYLGFESRQSFYDYDHKDEFSYTIKRARMKIEAEYEKKLSQQNCTGAIFALKNLGWKDRTETAITTTDVDFTF